MFVFFSGKYRVVYITPEFAAVAMTTLEELNRKVGIDLIAIDEAHCVSQWGHDFRSAYRQLGELKDRFQQVRVHSMTLNSKVRV